MNAIANALFGAAITSMLGCSERQVFQVEADRPELVAVEYAETIQPGTQLAISATCPDDAPRLAYGGCIFGGYRGSVTAVTNAPSVPQLDGEPIEPAVIDTWDCTGMNHDEELPGTVTAYAVCEVSS